MAMSIGAAPVGGVCRFLREQDWNGGGGGIFFEKKISSWHPARDHTTTIMPVVYHNVIHCWRACKLA